MRLTFIYYAFSTISKFLLLNYIDFKGSEIVHFIKTLPTCFEKEEYKIY